MAPSFARPGPDLDVRDVSHRNQEPDTVVLTEWSGSMHAAKYCSVVSSWVWLVYPRLARSPGRRDQRHCLKARGSSWAMATRLSQTRRSLSTTTSSPESAKKATFRFRQGLSQGTGSGPHRYADQVG